MVFGMFMAILDIQIVSASLSYIQAGLSASSQEVSWVQTAYLMAEIVMIPLAAFLSQALSTRWLFTLSAAHFTISSLACGLAWDINSISEARAQGDLSENAEYDAAKDRQGFIEGRIQEIEGKLSAAQIIDPTEVDAGGKVVFGSTIELQDEDSGDKVTYQIVGEDEADIKMGRVNIGSPIARALIGKNEGDTAEVQAPGGIKRYEIIAVMYV